MTTDMINKKADSGVASAAQSSPSRQTYTPPFDVWETDEGLVMRGDLPGVSPEDLELRFENRELTIRGVIRPRGEGRTNLHQEYGVGDYLRSFVIGEAIDSEGISAELKDGELTVHLPKSEQAKSRRIEVKSA